MPRVQPQGFLAMPGAGTGPGVLVLHPWWGLNETMKATCEKLAREGFAVFAPDLYRGKIAATIEEAKALSSSLNEERAKTDVAEAVGFLSEQADPKCAGLGVVGFSLGAYFALTLSGEDPDRIRAVVLFYGTGPTDFMRSTASYLGHFAGADPYEPVEQVKALEQTLRDAGRPADFHYYEGTGHWFFEEDRPDAYNRDAAQLAWQRTVAFLKEELRRSQG